MRDLIDTGGCEADCELGKAPESGCDAERGANRRSPKG
jgi:hypothetical protein